MAVKFKSKMHSWHSLHSSSRAADLVPDRPLRPRQFIYLLSFDSTRCDSIQFVAILRDLLCTVQLSSIQFSSVIKLTTSSRHSGFIRIGFPLNFHWHISMGCIRNFIHLADCEIG